MRREDRERSFGEEDPQHSSNREKEGTLTRLVLVG
jgi:hypothetical protein